MIIMKVMTLVKQFVKEIKWIMNEEAIINKFNLWINTISSFINEYKDMKIPSWCYTIIHTHNMEWKNVPKSLMNTRSNNWIIIILWNTHSLYSHAFMEMLCHKVNNFSLDTPISPGHDDICECPLIPYQILPQ
jgi:hypothetical protein